MMEKQQKLGEMLVTAGVISRQQLRSALCHQKNRRCLLGSSLVKLGYVSEDRLLEFLEQKLEMPLVDLRRRPIGGELLAYLPLERAMEYTVLPNGRSLAHGSPALQVAMADPTNLRTVDALAFLTGCRIEPVLAAEEDIRRAIKRCYGVQLDVGAEACSSLGGLPRQDLADRFLQLLEVLLEKGILTRSDFDRFI